MVPPVRTPSHESNVAGAAATVQHCRYTTYRPSLRLHSSPGQRPQLTLLDAVSRPQPQPTSRRVAMPWNPIYSRAMVRPVAPLTGFAVACAIAAGTGNAGPSTFARCTASVFHPVSVRVTALDPVARGAVVRLQVRASSAVPLDQAEIRLISTGGAPIRGASSVALGTLAPGRSAQGVFAIAIPSSGGRRYVQFQVTGQGPQGRLTRGACYNLLPDGPAETGHLVVTPQGQ